MKIKATLILILIFHTSCTNEGSSESIQIQAEISECLSENEQIDERKTINLYIQNSKLCKTDADCKLVFLACPFGCGTAVNSVSAEEVESMVDEYNNNSCYGCEYDCVNQTDVKCVENLCVTHNGLLKTKGPEH